jgi:hypothetical protein
VVRRRAIACNAQRVLDADPSRVWALVADPERLADWAGVVTVGYMGTELPKPGQRVFVKPRRVPGRRRRVEIESWRAGSAVSCVVTSGAVPTHYSLDVEPEIEQGRITTRIRLRQRSEVPAWLGPVAKWLTDMRLQRMLDRIARVVAS